MHVMKKKHAKNHIKQYFEKQIKLLKTKYHISRKGWTEKLKLVRNEK